MGGISVSVLTTDRRKALDVLVAGGDQTAAALAAGVTDRTLRRWLHEPAFVAALDEAQCAMLDAVTVDLVRASSGAVALLNKVIADPDVKTVLRLRAAQIVLDAVLRWRELRDVERRLTALEQFFSDDRGTA